MTRRLIDVAAGAVVATLLGTAAGAWGPAEVFVSGTVTSRKVVTGPYPRETQSENWAAVPDAMHSVFIAPGKSALISARFTAASACSEAGGEGESSRCDVRIVINGSPAQMAFAHPFDSTENGTVPANSVESHTVEAHRCVVNTSDKNAMLVIGETQWRVANGAGDADRPKFVVSNSSFTIERGDNCT